MWLWIGLVVLLLVFMAIRFLLLLHHKQVCTNFIIKKHAFFELIDII
jgi:hypothetical protein